MEFIKNCFEVAPILTLVCAAIIIGGYVFCLCFHDTKKDKVRAVIAWSLCLIGVFVIMWILTSDFFLIIFFVMFICYPVLRIFGGAILDLFRYFFRL